MYSPISSPRTRHLAAIAALVLAALTPVLLGAAPPQPLPTQRVDLRVLIVGATAPCSLAATTTSCTWQSELQREGVPFDVRATNAINDGVLADYGANRAKYEAVILTTGVPLLGGPQAALTKLESTFGIRQISEIGDTFNPAVYHGIDGFNNFGEQGGQVGTLTNPLGLQVFPYLKGSVPIDTGASGYQAVPTATGSFQRLLNGPGNSVYLGIYTDPLDLRQEMVMTVTSNQFQLHNQLLRHGMLNWVTRGVYLGTQRNYFSMNIDDIFLPDALWDPNTHSTPGDASIPTCTLAGAPVTCPEARMTPSDVRAAIDWQNANGIKFDFMFNGQGVDDAGGNPADTLTYDPINGLLANKSQFQWVNHTFTHAQFDLLSVGAASGEITNNLNFATANALPVNPQEIVTGEHSGLGTYQGVLATGNCSGLPCPVNPSVVTAFNNLGIKWAGDDNSAKPNQRAIGGALTVPRYPANVYYNVATRAAQLDEYNWIYTPPPVYGACSPTPVTTCRGSLTQWLTNSPNGDLSYVNSEVGIMFGHVMDNSPKPHYAHQTNLIMDANGLGILYKRPGAAGDPGVLDALLAKYNTYFKVPLVQPTLAESGQLLQKQAAWASNVGGVSGYLLDGKVHVVAAQPADVPITGTNAGDLYGGQRSGWTPVAAGDTVFAPSDPINAVAPALTGSPTQGSTLNAVAGSWVGTAPITTSYQWQRCNGPLCVNITGVIDANYKTGAIDRGFSLRVVQMAGNWISSVSQAPSASTTAIPGPPPVPGVPPPTAPAPGNVAKGVTRLKLTKLKVVPRRFKVAKIVRRKLVGGTMISWRLNARAKLTITVQKKKGKRWISVGSIQRDAKTGNSKYRFTGFLAVTRTKTGKLVPGAYRFAVGARGVGNTKIRVQTITFTVLKG